MVQDTLVHQLHVDDVVGVTLDEAGASLYTGCPGETDLHLHRRVLRLGNRGRGCWLVNAERLILRRVRMRQRRPPVLGHARDDGCCLRHQPWRWSGGVRSLGTG